MGTFGKCDAKEDSSKKDLSQGDDENSPESQLTNLTADSDEQARLELLRKEFPDSHLQELLRFCRARPKSVEDAAQMYRDHLQWRQGEGHPDNLLEAAKSVPQNYIRAHGTALDGSILVIVQAARYDLDIPHEKYVLACAHCADSCMGPEDNRKVTLLLDTRPQEGWPNHSAHKMLPFFKLAGSVLPRNYPERLRKGVLYSMPMILSPFLRLTMSFVETNVSQKIQVICGPGHKNSPCPTSLRELISYDQLPIDAQKYHQEINDSEPTDDQKYHQNIDDSESESASK